MFWIYYLSVLIIVFTFSTIVSIRTCVGLIRGLGTVIKRVAIFFIYLTFGSFLLSVALMALPILYLSRERRNPEEIPIEELKPGDIILTGNNDFSLFTVCIKLANILTNGIESKYWTHIALHTGNGELIEAVLPGVRNTSIRHYFDEGSLIKVYRHKYLNEGNAPAFVEMLVKYCRNIEQRGTQYGFGALVFYALSIEMPNILDWVFDDPFYDRLFGIGNKYFCSELAAEAYEACGHPISQFDGWRIKPSDFMRIPMFVEVSFKENTLEIITNQWEAAPTAEVREQGPTDCNKSILHMAIQKYS